MPALHLIVASGTSQRRLLQETVLKFEKKGYVLGSSQEGGEWATILSDNMSAGLFDEKKLVVIDSALIMGAMPEKLTSMVEVDSSVIIILVYDSDPSKLIPKEVLRKCTVLKPAEFPRWAREREIWVANLAKTMNVSINRDGISLIVEMLEDPEEVRGQLISLSILKKQSEISAKDVEDLCFDDGSRNLLKLLDGLCKGEKVISLKSLHAIAKSGDLIPLVSALHNRMRLAWYTASNPKNGALFAKALGARNYAWRMAGMAARRYSSKNIAIFVTGLIRLNIEEKSGTGAGWASLETLIISLLGDK